MPASSTSALNAWGLYLVAALLLLLITSPMLTAAAADARRGADLRELDGLKAVFDSLRPGVVAHFELGEGLLVDPIRTEGKSVTCSYGPGAISLQTRWTLPDASLVPGAPYAAWLEGGAVEVVRVG